MTWSAPECPFQIEWPTAVMEDIRTAAMEALFSLPHGGAEIGGVLWGTRSPGTLRILAARPLDCEHARGPRFSLSEKDHTQLRILLADAPADAPGCQPVGWYVSHTRSEVLLSPQDLEIHDRYFPHPWQIALVVRPHAMQPMRAGFFFREAGGMHADATYSEFLLHPDPAARAVAAAPPELALPCRPARQRSRWLFWWPLVLLAAAAGLLLSKSDRTRVLAAGRTRAIGLTAHDSNGQLEIRWDRAAQPIRAAESGTLEIADGATRTVAALERRLLRDGAVSYARTGSRVDVRLALREPGGELREEFTTFLGPTGGHQPDATVAALRRELQAQADRTEALEHTVAGLRWIIRQQQARRDSPP